MQGTAKHVQSLCWESSRSINALFGKAKVDPLSKHMPGERPETCSLSLDVVQRPVSQCLSFSNRKIKPNTISFLFAGLVHSEANHSFKACQGFGIEGAM